MLIEAQKKGDLIPEICCAYDFSREKCENLGVRFASVEEMVDEVDIIVEAASIKAVKEYGKIVVKEGKHLVVMSVGALLDEEFRKEIEEIAGRSGARIYVPSGAIGGIDAIKSLPKDTDVKIITTKPASTLGVDAVKKEVIFRGKASEAVEKFPRSMNVAAILSLVRGRDVDVEIIADPSTKRNTHRIVCSGSFGNIEIVVENKPSPYNPRTSYLACLSLIKLLNSLCEEKTIILGV